jgi:hypothetical protein
MIAFYDPVASNQVMAFYSHNTSSQYWARSGYVKAAIPEELVPSLSRDVRLVLDGDGVPTGVTPSVNPVQRSVTPQDSRLKVLRDLLKEDTISEAGIRELLRLERGL